MELVSRRNPKKIHFIMVPYIIIQLLFILSLFFCVHLRLQI